MASSPLVSSTFRNSLVNLYVEGESYSNIKLAVLPHLYARVMLGQDFMKMHESVEFN